MHLFQPSCLQVLAAIFLPTRRNGTDLPPGFCYELKLDIYSVTDNYRPKCSAKRFDAVVTLQQSKLTLDANGICRLL